MAKEGTTRPSRPKKVVITGASGNLGRKIRTWLEKNDDYDLISLDIEPRGDPDVVRADLCDYDESWVRLLRGADTVVHLAVNTTGDTPWLQLQRNSLDAVLNVFEAAAEGGVKRVVFASSNTVMDGYRHSGVTITPDLPPEPTSGYAAFKLAGERIGRSYSMRRRLAVICLRFGTIGPGENPPDHLLADWEQKRWLSNRDCCQAIEKAINAEGLRFAVLNVMSDIVGSPWDISETRRALGYEPQDRYVPKRQPLKLALSDFIDRTARGLFRRLRAR